jgi:HSP20 family molecular chaperone IbpA
MLQFQADTQPDAHQAAQDAAGPDKPAEGEGDGYAWKDQDEDVEITVPVGGVQKKDVKVTFKSAEVALVAPIAKSFKLYSKVDPDGCNWTLTGGSVVLTLEKKVAETGPRLLSDDGLQL